MSFCLKDEKSNKWLADLRVYLDHEDYSFKNPLTFETTDDVKNIKFFKDLNGIYTTFKKLAIQIPDLNLSNYEEFFSKNYTFLKNYAIWYDHYKLPEKFVRICDLNIKKIMFYHLFEKEYQISLINGLCHVSKKTLQEYDLLIFTHHPTNDSEMKKLIKDLQKEDIDAKYLEINPLGFILINQEDFNFLRLSFEKFKEIKYIRKTSELLPRYKKYKKIKTEIKKLEDSLHEFLCLKISDITSLHNQIRGVL